MWESRCSGVWVRGDTLLVSEPTKPLSVSGEAIQGSWKRRYLFKPEECAWVQQEAPPRFWPGLTFQGLPGSHSEAPVRGPNASNEVPMQATSSQHGLSMPGRT
jgi:hypothetical protein